VYRLQTLFLETRTLIDVNAILADKSICDPAIFAIWNGENPIYAHILDHVLRDARKAAGSRREPAKPSTDISSDPIRREEIRSRLRRHRRIDSAQQKRGA
jgi:hypothetical protein